MKELEKLITDAGFGVVVGHDAVIGKMIDLAPKNGSIPLCSGYGVFPGGLKCKGCPDCTTK